ncbi:Lipoprotein signal peptidase [Gimesia maris]|jgi:signal peptidase II|uniref:Lipoprotein signal peptidase n=1 Tax=Gimesia maris TaxID=122 RepID=A0A3D3RBS3_9PLAN|nr:signal peptidase II [Gimesia maris]MAC54955.1 signal peptidase II [Gimesia sp.]QDT80482.1 Lipoprotein signal peptidase [Gimesia maris]QDU16128.1 Lipoprotein signal peptidase [Gimesia maris]HCO26291.1 signal peptidase II [Gimesia maris]|tara:strand:- start:1871 stop:2428 length:558 start_codon:yes stop_codon:yes gene_type:complete
MSSSVSKATRYTLLIACLLFCVGCDQYTKKIAVEKLKYEPPLTYLNNTFRMEYAENTGAFLSVGSRLSKPVRFFLLVVANAAFLILVTGMLVFRWQMPLVQFIALSLLLAGGIGNLIDRVFLNGIVIDFLNIGFGPLRTGIFNVADMAITGGALLMLFSWFFTKDQIEQKKEQANSEPTTSVPAE